MHTGSTVLLQACFLLCLTAPMRAQTAAAEAGHPRAEAEDEPRVVVGVGAASSWATSGGAAMFGPNISAESTLIEHRLEVEVGVSPFITRRSTEWDTDFLAKKPWTLSPEAEFMLGAGPEWVHVNEDGRTRNLAAGEVVGDFMFWPTGHHRFGWFLEPVYDYSFAAGHQQSIGMSAGLLLGIARRHR